MASAWWQQTEQSWQTGQQTQSWHSFSAVTERRLVGGAFKGLPSMILALREERRRSAFRSPFCRTLRELRRGMRLAAHRSRIERRRRVRKTASLPLVWIPVEGPLWQRIVSNKAFLGRVKQRGQREREIPKREGERARVETHGVRCLIFRGLPGHAHLAGGFAAAGTTPAGVPTFRGLLSCNAWRQFAACG